jgi:hypothetical protein
MFDEGNTMDAMRWALTSAALCTGLLAGCDSATQPVEKTTAAAQAAETPPTPKLTSTATKSKDNLPPIQGQVDTREPAQRRAFEAKR